VRGVATVQVGAGKVRWDVESNRHLAQDVAAGVDLGRSPRPKADPSPGTRNAARVGA
jgi:hypothetical protein